jgi:hypothetical protein
MCHKCHPAGQYTDQLSAIAQLLLRHQSDQIASLINQAYLHHWSFSRSHRAQSLTNQTMPRTEASRLLKSVTSAESVETCGTVEIAETVEVAAAAQRYLYFPLDLD